MTNGDKLRAMMNDNYLAAVMFCAIYDECCDCPLNDITDECTDVQTRLEWLKQEVSENGKCNT